MSKRMLRGLVVLSALSISALCAAADRPELPTTAPIYDSSSTTDRQNSSTYGTPEQDARPGEYYFMSAVAALNKNQYKFAVDMYKTSASWAYKPAQYNLAVMYAKGEGIAADRPLALAWATLAAERGEKPYVNARELIKSQLTAAEIAKAQDLLADLSKTYADDVALRRAKGRWAQVKAAMTGSHVGAVGNLQVGGAGQHAPPRTSSETTGSTLDGNTSSAFGILRGGSTAGSIAYGQFRASDNPYDEKFERHEGGTATVEPIVPLPEQKPAGTDPDKPRNS